MSRFGCVLFLAAFLLASRAQPPVWPQKGGDLAPDPAAHFGTLPNGLRYVVLSHAEPRGRVVLRLLVRAGSLQETDRERGLAHFIEHVAFKGTRRFPDNTLIDALQRHGFAFGADISAFTFPHYTVYQLDAALSPPDRLAEALRVLRDFADGVTFDPAGIDRERHVVESERRARDNWQARAQDACQRFLLPMNRLPLRNPIGDQATVRAAGATELRRFYTQWYRADNLCVIAVGDLPAEKLEDMIRAEFSSMAAPATPLPPTPDLGWVGNPATLSTLLHTDPAAGAVSAVLCSVIAGSQGAETRSSRDAALRREIVLTMLNERFSQIRRDRAEIFGSAAATCEDWGQVYTETCLHIDTAQLTWREAVTTLVREWRRASELGFSAEEIAEAARIVRRRYEYAVAAEPTDPSQHLADRLVALLAEERVYSSWRQMEAQMEAVLAAFTPDEARRVFRGLGQPGAPRLFVAGNLAFVDPAKELADAYASGLMLKLNPPPRPKPATLDYHLADRPGAIKSRHLVRDLDVTQVEFANGVRLNLKHTDFSKNLVDLRARVGWGQQSEPAKLPGLGLLASYYLNEAGVGRHLGDELRRFLNQQNMSLGFTAEEDAFAFTGSSDARALADLLTLFAAYLDDCAWRPGDLIAVKNRIGSIYGDTDHEANSALNAIAMRVVSGDDQRLALPDPVKLRRHSFEDLMAWLDSSLRGGPVEIGLVGDFDIESAIQLAARTVGVSPLHAERSAARRLRPLPFHNQPGRWECTVDSAIPRGAVRAQWPVRGCGDIHRRRALEVLAGVLQERVRREIREKMGATYDPAGEVWSGITLRDDGYLIIQISALPADARLLSKRIMALADDLALHGASEEEMQEVVQPRLADNATRLRDNSYWLYYILDSAQQDPVRLDWPRTREQDFRTMSVAQINRLAAEFLGSKKAQLFTAVPK